MRSIATIVIPTYHRKQLLVQLLKSLNNTIFLPVELIIVEQEENNNKLFRSLINNKFSYKYIFLKKRSTAIAMNIGVNEASSRYVLFLDDDVIVHNNIVKYHLTNFKDKYVVATVGRIITDDQEIESYSHKTGRVNWIGAFTNGFSSTIRQSVDTVIGANTCWRKETYIKLGGIDEQFTGNALRLESDLSLRAKKLGYKIIFEPRAVVTHHRAPTGGARKSEGRIQWYFDFFSNETYFFLKHRPKILLPIFWLTKTEWALRCMFGFGREVSVRSMITPFAGMADGVRKYRDYVNRG